MELKVLHPAPAKPPWYGGGLRFTCSQCGNCCTGPEGYVWISSTEIHRLSEHLGIPTDQVIKDYCRKIGKKFSLKEVRNARGEYDCIFLKEMKAPSTNGSKVMHTIRACTIYEVRPLQCRTWPFWDGNLSSPGAWERAGERCHGMNNGPRVFSVEQIEALRDAKDWPNRPPTSKPKPKARRK